MNGTGRSGICLRCARRAEACLCPAEAEVSRPSGPPTLTSTPSPRWRFRRSKNSWLPTRPHSSKTKMPDRILDPKKQAALHFSLVAKAAYACRDCGVCESDELPLIVWTAMPYPAGGEEIPEHAYRVTCAACKAIRQPIEERIYANVLRFLRSTPITEIQALDVSTLFTSAPSPT